MLKTNDKLLPGYCAKVRFADGRSRMCTVGSVLHNGWIVLNPFSTTKAHLYDEDDLVLELWNHKGEPVALS